MLAAADTNHLDATVRTSRGIMDARVTQLEALTRERKSEIQGTHQRLETIDYKIDALNKKLDQLINKLVRILQFLESGAHARSTRTTPYKL
ncbi:hypothetical protein BS17DRAFT_89282 [Gyrodon lividus]|nr:hypothetical protein BS17DRAFT_89282 [Gyrodon lividus]